MGLWVAGVGCRDGGVRVVQWVCGWVGRFALGGCGWIRGLVLLDEVNKI